MTTIRVLLADDHRLMRAGLRALLKSLELVQVVAEAGNGHEAIQLAEQHQPDIVIMDIGMPELNGLEATARIVKLAPAPRIIVLSMHANEEYVRRALQAGAAGYLLKGRSRQNSNWLSERSCEAKRISPLPSPSRWCRTTCIHGR